MHAVRGEADKQLLGVLLTALSGINAVNAQNARYAWLDTALEVDYPYRQAPSIVGEIGASLPNARTDLAYQQLADVVVLLSLPRAGCTLASSVTRASADRKRPSACCAAWSCWKPPSRC